MHSFDQNLDDALAHQEESFDSMKSVQLVVSIVRAQNWKSTGVFIIKLGLQEIAGISQGAYGLWHYSLWMGEHHNSKIGYDTRFDAAFAAVSHHLKNQENRRETCELG